MVQRLDCVWMLENDILMSQNKRRKNMYIPNITNAYENIKKACDTKITQLFPTGVPQLVEERYAKELGFLRESDYIDDFEILRRLNAEANKCSHIFTMRGTITASYIAYLLSNSVVNPLPTHYYCPQCGNFEAVDTKLFGVDLPESQCRKCGSVLISDGFNLPVEMVWGTDGKKSISFEYNVSEEFLPFAKRVLESIYMQNEVAPLGTYSRGSTENEIKIVRSGFLILPTGQSIDDYPDLITYSEDGEICLSANLIEIKQHFLHRVLMIPNKQIENIISLQRKTGIYAHEIALKEIRDFKWTDLYNTSVLDSIESELFRTYKPKTFYDMVCLSCMAHNTYKESIHKLFEIPEFKMYPCYAQEDFFEELLKSGYNREKAFEISEFIKMGKHNSQMKNYIEKFDEFDIPQDLKAVAYKYKYLFPRSHGAEYVIMYAKLAYYAKTDRRIFNNVVLKKGK